eukprot:scaffold203469_cov66-Cyclotella_meneghiniana.AAC.4
MKANSGKAWNGFCFLVGAGGTGKTTLSDLFVASAEGEENRIGKIQEVARTIIRERGIHQADLADDGLFNDLQVCIARRQLVEERKHQITSSEHGTLVISDRSVIDALVYSIIREDSDLQRTKNTVFQRLCELVGDECNGREVIDRYQSALVVLVHPFNDKDTVDDNVRLLMNNEELHKYTAVCQQILTLLDIPFVDLRERNKNVRLNLLQDAIRCKQNK